MKIALINNLYGPFSRGGAEKVVQKMINDYQKDGHDVFLISTKPPKAKTPLENSCLSYFINSHYFNLANYCFFWRLIWQLNNLFFLKKIYKKILKKEKPDLVVTHNLMGIGFRLPALLRKMRIRHEHYLHDIQLLHPSGLIIFGQENIINSCLAKLYQFFTSRFFASPFKVISPSHWLLNEHQKKSFFKKSKLIVKPLMIIDKKEEKTENKQIAKNFLFVGQIENHKGIIFLIKTFKEALKIRPEIKLNIIGDGTVLKKAKEIANDTSAINFLGRLESSDVYDFMKKSDRLIVPSLCYENSPTTIYEAQKLNLPVIAARIGGIPEMMLQQDILFKPDDKEDLQDKILK